MTASAGRPPLPPGGALDMALLSAGLLAVVAATLLSVLGRASHLVALGVGLAGAILLALDIWLFGRRIHPAAHLGEPIGSPNWLLGGVAAVAILASLAGVLGGEAERRQRIRLEAGGKTAVGVVEAVEDRIKARFPFSRVTRRLLLSFTDEEGTRHTFRQSVPVRETVRVGDRVQVRYEAGRPGNCVAAGLEALGPNALYWLILVTAGATTAWWWVRIALFRRAGPQIREP